MFRQHSLVCLGVHWPGAFAVYCMVKTLRENIGHPPFGDYSRLFVQIELGDCTGTGHGGAVGVSVKGVGEDRRLCCACLSSTSPSLGSRRATVPSHEPLTRPKHQNRMGSKAERDFVPVLRDPSTSPKLNDMELDAQRALAQVNLSNSSHPVSGSSSGTILWYPARRSSPDSSADLLNTTGTSDNIENDNIKIDNDNINNDIVNNDNTKINSDHEGHISTQGLLVTPQSEDASKCLCCPWRSDVWLTHLAMNKSDSPIAEHTEFPKPGDIGRVPNLLTSPQHYPDTYSHRRRACHKKAQARYQR